MRSRVPLPQYRNPGRAVSILLWPATKRDVNQLTVILIAETRLRSGREGFTPPRRMGRGQEEAGGAADEVASDTPETGTVRF